LFFVGFVTNPAISITEFTGIAATVKVPVYAVFPPEAVPQAVIAYDGVNAGTALESTGVMS